MATEQLRQSWERAEKLSLKDQDMVAKQILEAIERIEADEEWNAIWENPKAIQVARRLAKEAREGEIEEGGFDDL
jgi:hypothetical protein